MRAMIAITSRECSLNARVMGVGRGWASRGRRQAR
jgi:hypothetical protein